MSSSSRSLPSESAPGNRTPPKRAKLPKEATEYLKDWLHRHADHPYPSEQEKGQMCATTGLTMSQISNWMINARRRILAPLRRAKSSSPAHAVESDHVPLLPPNGENATFLLQDLPSMPLNDLDFLFSTPALALPSSILSAEPHPFYPAPQQPLRTAHSVSASVSSANVRQNAFPGYGFTESTPEARAAYAISAMQAERAQRAMNFTPATFPYW